MKTAIILARGLYDTCHAKTAHGLIRHGKKYKIIGVIDENCAGKDAGEVIGLGRKSIPIVDEVFKADALIIGVAPAGGKLPKEWREDIKKAIKLKMDIISGLHDFLSDDKEFANLAKKNGVKIIDVRKPTDKFQISSNRIPKVPVILTCGTDCAIGKRTVTIELYNEAIRRGIDAGFIATGQTGIMIGCDDGAVIDRIPGDFMSGAIEKMIERVEKKGKKIIFVEGQGAISHKVYGAVSLGILYGANPNCIVLAHEPGRKYRESFPEQRVYEPLEEIKLLNALS
ncbi:MAG: DUF1611 domain-containing protein, partial [Candidatus Thermoplasmatota archaeon]